MTIDVITGPVIGIVRQSKPNEGREIPKDANRKDAAPDNWEDGEELRKQACKELSVIRFTKRTRSRQVTITVKFMRVFALHNYSG